MRLTRIAVRHVRNIAEASLSLHPRLNLVVGPNGSGKTSLLEAVGLLCNAASFRDRSMARVMSHGSGVMAVRGELERGGRASRVGLVREEGKTRIHLDGKAVTAASTLARELPAVVVRPESHALIGGGPGERRRFMDWSLFHVEPAYLGLWKRFHKLLRQRNSLLKRAADDVELATWDTTLARQAEELTATRGNYVDALANIMCQRYEGLVPAGLAIRYDRGWSEDVEYQRALVLDRPRDRRHGYTRQGPHRADLLIRSGDRDATHLLSRGQAKLVITALMLSQARLLRDKRREGPILLLDDVYSELDPAARGRLLSALEELDLQVVMTTAAPQDVQSLEQHNRAVFHVEHGHIEQMS